MTISIPIHIFNFTETEQKGDSTELKISNVNTEDLTVAVDNVHDTTGDSDVKESACKRSFCRRISTVGK
jgi:hypothetical protein